MRFVGKFNAAGECDMKNVFLFHDIKNHDEQESP